MDKSVEGFGQLLYRGDAAALKDLGAALADWRAFYARHADDLGLDVGYYEGVWADGVDPWGVLIDVGCLHKFVFEADHREFVDEIVAGVRGLRSAAGLTVEWDALAATDDEVEVEAFLDTLGSEVRRAGGALVILDEASDSYPLAVLPADVAGRAAELARGIAGGKVVIVGGAAGESKWLTASDPAALLGQLDRASKRKLRLFACACCRRIQQHLPDGRSVAAIEASEAFADRRIGRPQLTAAQGQAMLGKRRFDEYVHPAQNAAASVARPAVAPHWVARLATWAVGNHAAWTAAPGSASSAREPAQYKESLAQVALLRCIFGNPFRPVAAAPGWLTSTVVALARTIYDDRAFDLLPVLADALMDAGCDSEVVLAHCRDTGPHARGCWVVDLLLARK